MKVAALILLLVLLLPIPTGHAAQQDPRTFVSVDFSGDDRVGKLFVYYLKEEIARSSRYTSEASGWKATSPWLSVSIVSVDADNPEAGRESAISVVGQRMAMKQCDVITSHLIMVVGASKPEQMAKEAMANLDEKFRK
jgi:hypothetical protein